MVKQTENNNREVAKHTLPKLSVCKLYFSVYLSKEQRLSSGCETAQFIICTPLFYIARLVSLILH